jgi:hypothetical protein
MKKIILILFFFFPIISNAQKAIVGYTEDEIRESNKQDFPEITFSKEYFKEFWVLKSFLDGVGGIYYFQYGVKESFMCVQSMQDSEKAERYFLHLKSKCKKIEDSVYYDPDSELFIKIKLSEDGLFMFIWTEDRI